MMELTSSWLNAEWENHRTLLSWPRPLRPCSLGAMSRWHSSVSLWRRAERRTPPEQFLSTQPPLFHKADEPLEADSWLRTIESKFTLHPYQDGDKAGFAAQQLRGPARTWWDNHVAMFPAGTRFTWAEFKNAFRAHHIPAGVIRRKLTEFLALKQGNNRVLYYS